jgi:hypothetical protein
MFNLQNKNSNQGLEDVIAELLAEMQTTSGETEEYAAMADQLAKLYPLKKHNTSMWPTPDTLAIVAANLFGIILVIKHEEVNVITSKALGFIPKLR